MMAAHAGGSQVLRLLWPSSVSDLIEPFVHSQPTDRSPYGVRVLKQIGDVLFVLKQLMMTVQSTLPTLNHEF